MNLVVLPHLIRRNMFDRLKGAPGLPRGGSLWQKLATYITQLDPVDFVSIGDAAANQGLASALRLAAGCEFETLQTTAPPLTGDVNDYDPGPGFFVDLHPTGNRTITGLAGGATGVGATNRWHVLRNAESYTLTFPNESSSSASGNRFFCFTANAKVVLYGGESALVFHEPGLAGSGRWLIWKVVGETSPKPFTLGDLHYINSAPELAILAGNTAALRKVLVQLGTGSASAAPSWDTRLDRLGLGAAADGTAPLRVFGGEILQESAANGAVWKHGYTTELITVAAASTTDSVADLLPTDSVIEAVVARVTVTIPTATSFRIGDPTTSTRFATGVGVAAGSTAVGLNHQKGSVTTDAAGPTQSAADKVRLGMIGGTPVDNSGRVRVTVFYRTFVAPTS